VTASLAGWTEASDPALVGRDLVHAVAAILCRAVHARRTDVPCDRCAAYLRPRGPLLGRVLFMVVMDAPYGARPPTMDEYGEVGRLLEQLERIAVGKPPIIPNGRRSPW
jgi:hypothetical protein